jgi:hypothetical protein
MRTLVFVLAVLLFILHQDFWLWDNRTLVFGFLPAGLAYHAGYSIAASLLWAFAVFYAWPEGLEEQATPTSEAEGGDGK